MTRIAVVLLAAGRSSRFAGPATSKLVATVDGEAVVRLAARSAIDAEIGDVVVVTGAHQRDVAGALAGLPVSTVHASRFADGMAFSLRCGIEAVRDREAAIIALGDQPGVQPDAYRRVVAQWRSSGASIVIPRYAGSHSPGHPVLFAAPVFPELLELEGDSGARSVIAREPSRVAEAMLDWPAPSDIDTVDDLRSASRRQRTGGDVATIRSFPPDILE